MLIQVGPLVRNLARRPGFSLGVISCLALALGTAASCFLYLYGTQLRPLPVAEPARLVWIGGPPPGWEPGDPPYPLSPFDVADLRRLDDVFSGVIAYVDAAFVLRHGRFADLVNGQTVTANYFSVLGVRPALGRGFLVAGRSPEAPAREVVLGHALWRSSFGADPAVVGASVLVSGEPFVIVGVAPAGFHGTEHLGPHSAFWVPLPALPWGVAPYAPRYHRSLGVIARLRRGVSVAAAQDAAARLARRLEAADPESRGLRFEVFSSRLGQPHYNWRQLALMAALLIPAGWLLMCTGANVTSLIRARTRSRARELRTRLALGAGIGEVVAQILAETLVLSLAAGAAALFLAAWAGHAMPGLRFPRADPVGVDFDLDGRVIAFTLLLAAATGLLAGLAPALEAFRTSERAFREPPAARAGRARAGKGGSAGRWTLLSAQLAVATFLLIVGSLPGHGLLAPRSADPGFRNTDVIVIWAGWPAPYGTRDPRAEAALPAMLDRIRGLPEVRAAALVLAPPFGSWRSMDHFTADESQPLPAQQGYLDFTAITPGYFTTMGIALLAGRDFGVQDRGDSPPVAIVNRAAADLFWPAQPAVGRRLHGADGHFEVVGVVESSHHLQLDGPPPAFVYLPLAQHPAPAGSFVFRPNTSPAAAANAVRCALLDLDAKTPLGWTTTMASAIDLRLGASRLLLLLGLGGLLTLAVATTGIYGAVAGDAVERRGELGLRLALGAKRSQLAGLLWRRSFVVLCAGSTLGALAAMVWMRLLRLDLAGSEPFDSRLFVEVPALSALIALAAGLLSARWATRHSLLSSAIGHLSEDP